MLDIFANEGVQVNAAKTKIHSFDPASPHNFVQDEDGQGNGQPRPLDEIGFKCVGVPIGSAEYVQKTVQDIFGSMSTLIDRELAPGRFMYQRAVGNRQIRKQDIFSMLNYCISARPIYLVRNVDPAITIPALELFDRRMTDCLMTLLGMDPDEPNSRELFERQRSIPRKDRGLGVRKFTGFDGAFVHVQYNKCTEDIRAFIARYAASDLLRGPEDAVQALHNQLVATRDIVVVAPNLPNRHRYLNNPDSFMLPLLYEKVAGDIQIELTALGKRSAAAIWLSGRFDQAGAFLDYHGGNDPREMLTDDQFTQYGRVWCSLAPYAGNVVQMECACQAQVDQSPWHYLVCKKASKYRYDMHQALVYLIYSHIKEFGGLDPNRGDFIVADCERGGKSLDPQQLCRIANMQGHQGHPGQSKVDILLYINGRVTAFDVTIANPAAAKYVKLHSDTLPEVAIRERTKTKNGIYLPLLPPQSESNRFLVLAFEVTGRMETTTRNFLKSMTPRSSDYTWRKFQSLLSMAIARFIADEVRHGIDGTQYLNGQHPMDVPADVFQDAEEDGPPQGPPV